MHKTASSKMKNRMRVVLLCFLALGFCVLIGRLFTIQIVHGEMYQARAAQQQTRAMTLGAERGSIFDRNGNALARSATVWNVCISPADIKEEDLPKLAYDLSEILDVDQNDIIEKGSNRSTYYQRIKMRIDRTKYEEVLTYITENQADGIFFEVDTKRYYVYGSLASTVLGFTNYDGDGAYGLESYYNKVLSGTPGVVVSAKDALGSDMDFKFQQMNDAIDGNSLVLTIDEAIQHFVEKNLETAIVEHGIGNRAASIVMNVKTGEILAMATKEDFDPNDPYTLQSPQAVAELEALSKEYPEDSKYFTDRRQELLYDQWRNKAISDPYEPGSVFKIITAATALDNKVVSLHDQFYCSGTVEVSGVKYGCWHAPGHGQQDFIKGMQNSCNPVFIAIGQRIGAKLFYDYMDNFGFGQLTGIDLPGEAEGIRQSFETLNKPGMVELSSTSFGQTFKVTSIQLITAASAAVNGGYLMEPYIVKQVLDSDGNVIETTQPTVKRQVISEETSAEVRTLVEAVVDGGSGRYAAIPGYRIGGKTGTSEKLDIRDRDVNVLSFIGFAPMDDPEYAVLVILDEPKLDDLYGSVIAAPVVGAIMQEMLPYLGLEPQLSAEEMAETHVKVPYLIYEKPHDAQAKLTGLGLQTRIVGNGADVIRQIPQAGQTIAKGQTVTLYTDEEVLDVNVEVPNVVGLSAAEANKILVSDYGLNIELQGVTTDGAITVVAEQWPLPGATAQTGDIVILTLREQVEESAPAEEAAIVLP